MSELTLRINANYCSPESLHEWCKKRCKSYLISKQEVGHVNKTPHYHIYLRSNFKRSTIRVSFKKTFPQAIGNGGYSIAKIKTDSATAEAYTIKSGWLYASPQYTVEALNHISKQWVNKKELKAKNSKSKYARYYEFYSQSSDYFSFCIKVIQEQISKDLLPPHPQMMSKYYHYCLFKDDIKNKYYDNIKQYYSPIF